MMQERQAGHVAGTARIGVVVGALGVVFGDIGTSPIYTLQTVFNPADPHPVPVSTQNVYGVVSLIFWSVMIIVTITYVLLALRVDNDGEGGIMALITLLRQSSAQRGRRAAMVLAALGIFGAALFFGDSMITPAISVLSAVEGVKMVEPSLGKFVVPITALIIVLLFLVQRRGTAAVGRLFGPIMIAWFVTIGALGAIGITEHPAILKALSPSYAIGFLIGHFHIAFFALAAIVLAVTGAEALYADMGHFGRKAITRGWLFLVLPACTLSYLGQGALVLEDQANLSGPFFLLVPDWGRLPLVMLATAATVIAAQAVITGAYSVASQAAQLGYLPRLRVHTPPSRPSARSTSRGSTGCSWSRCSPWCSRSAVRRRWPTRTGWRSPARSPSRRCCSSTSRGRSGRHRPGCSAPAPPCCSRWTCCSSPPT